MIEVEVRQWSDAMFAVYVFDEAEPFGTYVDFGRTREEAQSTGDRIVAERSASPVCLCGHPEFRHSVGRADEMTWTWCAHENVGGSCHCRAFAKRKEPTNTVLLRT